MLKNKNKILIMIIIVLLFTSLTYMGCSNIGKNIKSSEVLNISSKMDLFKEEDIRQSFALEKEICLAKDGESDYVILISANANEDLINLAKSLKEYLNKIIGSVNCFNVKSDDVDVVSNYISLGDTSFAEQISKDELKDDGYYIKSIEKNIFLNALNAEYLSNAVYGFLEDELQCMFARSDFDYIPSMNTVYLSSFDKVCNPDFSWRKVFQFEVSQNNWFKKLKNNGAVADAIEVNNGWGTWCHNQFLFVEPEIYINSNPEYFVIEKGVPSQLCLTNKNLYPIIERKMSELIANSPEKKYWDFSINDNNNYCKCENCQKVLKETGSMMGTMLPIINSLAKKFPDKIISTLAYFYNEKPPKGISCEPNVNIVLAPIVSGQLYSYYYGGNAKAEKTKALVESWSKLSSSILIWDYVVNFAHLLLPYPNFEVQKDNHKLYLENNVKAVFHQGSRESGDEFAQLRSYILSKQLWDNNIDLNATIAKYLTVTYGKAGKNVAKYLDLSHKLAREKAKDLDLYDNAAQHKNDYLSVKAIKEYGEIIDEAIILEIDDKVIVKRLEEIKINILYAKLSEPSWNVFEKEEIFKEFKVLVENHDIERPYEVGATMDEFVKSVYPSELQNIKLKIILVSTVPLLSLGIIITLILIYKKSKIKIKLK